MKSTKKQCLKLLWKTLGWVAGLVFILIIWTILANTYYKDHTKDGHVVLPDIIACFKGLGEVLSKGEDWKAIGIAFGQNLCCFIGSLVLSVGFVVVGRYWKPWNYFMMPIITFIRSIPTVIVIVLITVFLVPALWLVPVVTAFFIVFPIIYDSINRAVIFVNKKYMMVAKVFKVSKKTQLINIYLPSVINNIFTGLILTFGLTFKVLIASQVIQTGISPGYESIGLFITKEVASGNYAQVVAWGMILVFFSVVIEALLILLNRVCCPSRYKVNG